MYNGSQLTQETVIIETTADDGTASTTDVLYYSYDASGDPMAVEYTDNSGAKTTYYYVVNIQGDVAAILNTSGTAVVTYTYDAWGNPLSTDGTQADALGKLNSLRYRGYVYDTDTGWYYLQSRYYDPTVGRFINADLPEMIGADGELTGYNLFSYCGNNPINGSDPTGYFDFGGVIAGLGIIAGTALSVATFGIGSPIGLMIAGAAITTGAVMTYAAANDAAMVVDLSLTIPVRGSTYTKLGVSMIVDFAADEVNTYNHVGGGFGMGGGLSYSAGIVSNYNKPSDYSKHFFDVNAAHKVGIDHCWNPLDKHKKATQATSITFSVGRSGGVGYDYYSKPHRLFGWGNRRRQSSRESNRRRARNRRR